VIIDLATLTGACGRIGLSDRRALQQQSGTERDVDPLWQRSGEKLAITTVKEYKDDTRAPSRH
jgi:hypothetical protein